MVNGNNGISKKREELMVSSKRNKNQRNKVKVVCQWTHLDTPSPQFRRLMSLLLSDKRRVSDGEREKQKPS